MFAFSPNGSHLAFVTVDSCNPLIIMDLVAQETSVLGESDGVAVCVVFSSDGKYVAVSTTKGIYVWEWGMDGTERIELDLDRITSSFREEWTPWSIAYSSDGRLLISHFPDKTVRVWTVGTWTTSNAFSSRELGEGVQIASSPDSRYVILSSFDNFGIWDISAQPLAFVHSGEQSLHGSNRAMFSPDGGYVASAVRDSVHLWKGSTWSKYSTFKLSSRVKDLAFSPGNKHIASYSFGEKITIWDITSRAWVTQD